MKRKLIVALLTCTLAATTFIGCGSKEKPSAPVNGGMQTESGENTEPAASGEDLSGTLTFAIWDNNLNDFIEQNDMVGKFQEKYPNIEIEYVFYWKDMFEEAGVTVPTTYGEFEETAKKLQDYYGKDNPDFMAIACGLKDEWPDYPYMEFMPALESGNGQNWNTMAGQDAPFAEGNDIYKAYQKVNSLFTSGVLGKDPLGLGNDQVTSLFATKNAAILALGDWGLQNIQSGAEDISQLGTFYLPTRNSESDPYNVIVQGDSFMGVTTHSKNQEAAIAFVEWFYSDAWYPDYINYVTSASSMTNFPKDKDPVLAEADELCPDKVLIMYDGGGDDFTAIQNETTFDYKKLGAQMMTDGFDLNAALSELNEKWAAARAKLEIQ